VVLSPGMLQAAPDDAGEDFVPPFTAKEIAQGYTDQKILAM